MRARLDLCKAKGFDAVEPDNIEIHDNDTGFPPLRSGSINLCTLVADEAHARGLAIGIKNARIWCRIRSIFSISPSPRMHIIFIGSRRCCHLLKAGKAVFAAEYTDMDVDFPSACVWGKLNGVSFIQKNRILTAFRIACP